MPGMRTASAFARSVGVDVGGALNLVGSLIKYLSPAFLFPAFIAVGYGEPVWPFLLAGAATAAFGVGLERVTEGRERIGAPQRTLQPASWVEQGFPYYSGRGLYRQRFALPDDFAGQRIFLEPEMRDDTLEVLVNDQRAAVRLWEPYEVDLTDHLKPGDNTLELRVANTPINLLEAVPRPSGLAGPPRLVPYRPVTFAVPGE